MGIIGAAGALGGGAISAHASGSAADKQAQSAQAALDFQKQMWADQQNNLAPWISSGNTSIAALMKAMAEGKFGAGSLPAFDSTFTAPTLEEARNSPGYQFTAQQGSKGILQGAAAAGGAISGGTLRALDSFNTGLADSTYNDVFSRALSTYNAGMSKYQLNLARQAQEFQEMFAPAQLGEAAAAGLNNTGTGVASNVGNLMTSIGNAQAAGTVGSANAWNSGIAGATNSITQAILMRSLFGGGVTNPGVVSTGVQPGAGPSIAAAQAAAAGTGQGPG